MGEMAWLERGITHIDMLSLGPDLKGTQLDGSLRQLAKKVLRQKLVGMAHCRQIPMSSNKCCQVYNGKLVMISMKKEPTGRPDYILGKNLQRPSPFAK